MRSKIMLIEGFEDIKILQQYLYMDETNHIQITNALNVPLEIRMDEQCHYWCKNLNFPDVPELDWSSDMTLETTLNIIDELQNTSAIQFPHKFENRWEEIKTLANMNLALNIRK